MDIRSFSVDDITDDHLTQLAEVFPHAGHNTHMQPDFVKDVASKPDVFRAFFAFDKERIIGVLVVETKPHEAIDYMGFPPVHIKRFTVLPEFRSQGIGKQLMDAAKEFAFVQKGLQVLFGESNETGALAFYGREGALFSLPVIEQYSQRNAPEDNITFFKEFLVNPIFRTYRYPVGHGILFVYCVEEVRQLFLDKHFVPFSFFKD